MVDGFVLGNKELGKRIEALEKRFKVVTTNIDEMGADLHEQIAELKEQLNTVNITDDMIKLATLNRFENLEAVLRELIDRLIETLSGEIEGQSLEWFIEQSNEILEKLDSGGSKSGVEVPNRQIKGKNPLIEPDEKHPEPVCLGCIHNIGLEEPCNSCWNYDKFIAKEAEPDWLAKLTEGQATNEPEKDDYVSWEDCHTHADSMQEMGYRQGLAKGKELKSKELIEEFVDDIIKLSPNDLREKWQGRLEK